ncbi:hypothetical protein OOK44_17445 [Streptomyces cellulosae]|uniref:hypothetical protein n=1 Tax=Streptomyces cellulosae TaxID=1968 RepID=UPI00225B3385|nr:hypothetical protein [Streptomyces cellulosae]WTB89677.1 hypothetical protein OIE99_16190 [Streptomyces cellulosae]
MACRASEEGERLGWDVGVGEIERRLFDSAGGQAAAGLDALARGYGVDVSG